MCLQLIRRVLQLSGISSLSSKGLSREDVELGRGLVGRKGVLQGAPVVGSATWTSGEICHKWV